VDSAALVAASAGVIYGAGTAVLIMKRQWWLASALAAIGAQSLLGIVTAGKGSPSQHDLVWITSLVLLGYATIALLAFLRTRSRGRSRSTQATQQEWQRARVSLTRSRSRRVASR